MSETSAVLRDGRSGFDTLDLLALGLLIDDLTQRRLVAVLELVRFEVAGLGLHNVLREIEHLLLDLDVRNVLEIIRLVPDLVGVTQERAHQSFSARLQRDHVLTRGQHETPKRDFAGGRYCLPDGDERVSSDLTLRGNEIGPDVVEVVDLLTRDELVDVDGPG